MLDTIMIIKNKAVYYFSRNESYPRDVTIPIQYWKYWYWWILVLVDIGIDGYWY